MADGDVDFLKKYCHCKNSTACAIGFMKMVGANSYALPKRVASAKTIHFIHFVYGNQNQMAHSGWNSAERYFREGMLALPYRLRKFYG